VAGARHARAVGERLALGVLAGSLCGLLCGQAPVKPAFDAVSVKPSGTNRVVLMHGQSVAVNLRGVTYAGRRVTCNTDLRSILREAYSVKDYQIVAPEWLSSNTYEVIAVMPEGATREDARRMLQMMLEERFGLRLRRENKPISVSALVVAKRGFQGRAAEDGAKYTSGSGTGMLTATAITFDRLAEWLSRIGSIPVVNETGLEGRYQVDLHWPPEDSETGRGAGLPGGLAAALESQLGIKLEKRTMACDLLVIDHIEKTPTVN
jgi:uncharacterized protein (TIGR03435 family)